MSSQWSQSSQNKAPVTPAWQMMSTATMRENPERVAWAVLITSFVLFLILAISIPSISIYIVRHATVEQTTKLEPTLGTVLLYLEKNADPIAVTSGRDNIVSGVRIVGADDATQATLSLNNDESTGQALGSVQIYHGTDLRIVHMRRPMFSRSRDPYQTRLYLNAGQVRVLTNSGADRSLRVEIETPHGLITLGSGSYQVSVESIETEITTRSGQATLEHLDDQHSLTVPSGQRAWMTAEAISDQAAPAEQNLVRNSNFISSGLETWPSYQTTEASTTPGQVQFPIEGEDGRRVSHFIRMGEEKLHTEVGVNQVIDKAVNVYDDLRIQLDVKILFQSLPGAGSLNSEFPLRVEIGYRDVYGKDLTWGHGFYYRDPEPGEPYPAVVNGTKVSQGQWYTYSSPNLIDLLNQQGTRPAYIQNIRIYASGHNYQSMASEVYLLAK